MHILATAGDAEKQKTQRESPKTQIFTKNIF
jgi:hypothetical protein